jgi:hypothetical protein
LVGGQHAGVLKEGVGELIPIWFITPLGSDGDAPQTFSGGFSLFGHDVTSFHFSLAMSVTYSHSEQT